MEDQTILEPLEKIPVENFLRIYEYIQDLKVCLRPRAMNSNLSI